MKYAMDSGMTIEKLACTSIKLFLTIDNMIPTKAIISQMSNSHLKSFRIFS